MNQKAKFSGKVKRLFYAMLGPRRTKKLSAWLIERFARLPPLSLPIDVATVKRVLFIMPKDILQVLQQLRNILSISSLFRNAELIFLCEQESAALISLIKNGKTIEYDADSWSLHSPQFHALERELRGTIDLCFLLEKSPDLPTLLLPSAIRAPVRVGYDCSGDYPFVNFHIKPSGSRIYAPDWNSAMAALIGAPPGKKLRWSVSKQTMEQIEHMISESRFPKGARLLGVDLHWFLKNFGRDWCELLLKNLRSRIQCAIYMYADSRIEPNDLEWLRSLDTAVFTGVPVSWVAGLVSRSELVISGNALLFGLALLLDKPAIGLFPESELDANCPQSSRHHGISYSPADRSEELAMKVSRAAIDLLK